MAPPLSADKFLSVLKNAQLGVVEHGKWRSHNRNSHGNWGPVNGVMIHHTGGYSSEEDMVELCRTGYNDLPGPLCHGVIDRSGTVHIVGYGRTNHAGMGDTDVLLNVIGESENLPHDNEADTDGNRHFYGFECINTGRGQTWPSAQLDAMARAAAAVCEAQGWNEHSVIGHKEWQPGKTDPYGIDMDDFRARVGKLLRPGAGKPRDPDKPKPSKPRPEPEKPKQSGDSSRVPAYAPFPGADQFRARRTSAVIAAMGERLVAEGCDTYPSGPGSTWNEDHRRSYAAWQLKCGYRGPDADGLPGQSSWSKLRVPNPKSTSTSNPASSTRKDGPDTMPQTLADVAERTLATYAEAFIGLIAASHTTDLVDLSAWQSAAVAALPAALAAFKSSLGTVVGRWGTGSWLPKKADPATGTK
ncbi:peptidoglycan-binding protein [Streptomyces sp. TRM66268-LWL]|uniref:Peptidoglycan-binding protein n=1 Tax=Streptomyces polyasparticus TaxID=2767826 RepID=A0ABR7SQM6_9ACTN|nr:peptidoglycan-binding protein [Streptomyces polyasparticus]MBC9717801.1 peptidoglycan-binding protein [Streptomyces polyasparticus]